MRTLRLIFILVSVLLAGFLSYVYLFKDAGLTSTYNLKTGVVYPENFRKISPFTLQDHNGNIFSNASLENTFTLIVFGFTHCPDICPATLVDYQHIEKLLPSHYPMQYIFISVDPKRDTTHILKRYVGSFSPKFLGVTGEEKQLATLAHTLAAYYKIPDTAAQPYLVEHSASIYLIDKDAKLKALFTYPHQTQLIAEDILLLLKDS